MTEAVMRAMPIYSFYGGAGNVGGPLINHRVQAAAI
jgi:hypothetical protein